MLLAITLVFIIGYLFIALEHPFRIDKSASALLTGVICWVLLVTSGLEGEGGHSLLEHALPEHLSGIAAILFFLLGAMTIVELVDAHNGFQVITDRIKTVKRVPLIWVLSWVTFFLSAALDNMTTAIVMAALLRKLVRDRDDLWLFGGFVVIAANAGGAWSPIGDVTTIMLWVGGQVSTFHIIKDTFLASFVSLLAPLTLLSFFLKGQVSRPENGTFEEGAYQLPSWEKNLIFIVGVGGLLFVPFFKNMTHLPPYMGILFSLGILWVITEVMHRNKAPEHKANLSVTGIIRRVDTPSVLFFLGILLAVGALESAGILGSVAGFLDRSIGNIYAINTIVGVLSAIVDNVPIVAGIMGMYPLSVYPQDDMFWALLAYCAGTGGSMLIIGSAAGVAIMGILKIDFLWYLKRVSLYAVIGYFSGIAVYYLTH